jgi:hypothetical protein
MHEAYYCRGGKNKGRGEGEEKEKRSILIGD